MQTMMTNFPDATAVGLDNSVRYDIPRGTSSLKAPLCNWYCRRRHENLL